MLNRIFSLEFLLEKIAALIGMLLLALILLYYQPLVSILSRTTPEILAKTIIITILIIVLIVFVALIFVSLLYSENKQLKSKPDEGILKTHFGVNWKVYLTTGEVSDTPYCGCCSPPKLLTISNYDTNYMCIDSRSANHTRYYPLAENGNPLTFQQAYQKVKDIYKKNH